MSIYFIDTGERVYELSSTTSISKTISGKVTDNPVESGESIADNYVQMPDSFVLEGVITDISLRSGFTNDAESTEEFITEIEKIKNDAQVFTFFYGYAVSSTVNCLFESVDIKQDQTHGYINWGDLGGINSFKIKARFKQVNFTEPVTITQKRDFDFEDKFATEQESSQTTKSVTIGDQSELQQALDASTSGIGGSQSATTGG